MASSSTLLWLGCLGTFSCTIYTPRPLGSSFDTAKGRGRRLLCLSTAPLKLCDWIKYLLCVPGRLRNRPPMVGGRRTHPATRGPCPYCWGPGRTPWGTGVGHGRRRFLLGADAREGSLLVVRRSSPRSSCSSGLHKFESQGSVS
jgi:hypothetical protein